MYSLRGDLESPIILPLVGIPLVPASLLNTTSTDSIQADLDLVIQKLTGAGGEGIRDTLDQYRGALPGAGAAAAALTDATPQDVVTSAVEGNIEGLGTNVVVDGATLNAGRDLSINARESSDFASDTSTAVDLMYAIAPPANSAIAVYSDRSFVNTHDIAVASLVGGASATAGRDVLVQGEVTGKSALTATTGTNTVQNLVGAYVDDATIMAGRNSNVHAQETVDAVNRSLLPRYDGLQFKQGTNDVTSIVEAKVGNGSAITAGTNANINAVDDTTAAVLVDAVTMDKKGPIKGLIPAGGIAAATNTVTNTVSHRGRAIASNCHGWRRERTCRIRSDSRIGRSRCRTGQPVGRTRRLVRKQ